MNNEQLRKHFERMARIEQDVSSIKKTNFYTKIALFAVLALIAFLVCG